MQIYAVQYSDNPNHHYEVTNSFKQLLERERVYATEHAGYQKIPKNLDITSLIC
jgi:hypothetical protein